MRSILKYTVFTIFCGLFIMQAVVTAQDKSTQTSPDKADKTAKPVTPRVDKELKVEFPDIDGWEKSEITKYPTAALGYSIGYNSPEGGAVTVYVYNGGMKNIPDGATDNTVKSELERAKGDIRQAGKMGYYEDVKEIKNDTITLGGATGKVKALRSLFNFSARGQAVTSEIYIFGYQNNFIKIRATRPKEEDKTENKAVADLLAAIDALFSK